MRKLLLLIICTMPMLATAQKLEVGVAAGYTRNRYNRVYPEGPLLNGTAVMNYKFLQYGMGMDIGCMVYESTLRFQKTRKKFNYYIVKPYTNPYMLVNAVARVEKLRLYGGVNMGFLFERLTKYRDLYEINNSIMVRFLDADSRNRITFGVQGGLSYGITKQLDINAEVSYRSLEYRKNYYMSPITVGVRWKL